ncbi:molybdenum ABC transporter ATP-binding protein [Herminiimonas fonticola]|uniref:Molybdate transport system ATP-binding protein n=1 Tax=Herminiimonas fonticola TaxID=303380 RepID=A0A4R6GHK3_9BURK|nr:molybdenum ABC transporter ATP-binding protein [Herminiimonas fonticola]RBA24597.1 molybdate ABC transporter, ATP-binding protein [Herminiimonas fonticola]TDN93714.1 molybdate transport system ATP-binding protein [Herminiimonas fonticola]
MSKVANQINARFKVSYGAFSLDVDLALPGRGVSALFGTSGSGKTTCLRVIAGLERASDAYLEVNGEVWQDDARGIFLPTYKRSLGYVFQEASLFPHLDVKRNLEYGMRRISTTSRQVSLDHAVALLDIGHLMQRKPDKLSGGERQRVAIARALATSPRILLMDEPLAALDAKRKSEIMPYLERLHDELDIPILYVSHSPEEVARLADHLVLLESGKVIASGATNDLLTRLDLDVAHGDAASALVTATISAHDPDYHLTSATFSGGQLLLPQQSATIGQQVRIRVQARDVSLSLTPQRDTSILNIVAATVTELSADAAGQVMVGLDANGTRLLARITSKSCVAMDLVPGKALYAQIKGIAILK